MDVVYKEIVEIIVQLNNARFPFVPDAEQLKLVSSLESKSSKAEAILRLRGNIAERVLCSKYGLVFNDDSSKKNIKQILQEISVSGCSSNLTPDAYSFTEDGKVMVYEFGIRKRKKEEKEFMDRKKWLKLSEKYPILIHVETISSFDDIENPYVRMTLQKIERKMVEFFKKLDKDEELREINLKYFWEIRDLFQQYPYSNKFINITKEGKQVERTNKKDAAITTFPSLDKSKLKKDMEKTIAQRVKNIVNKRIKEGTTFYRETTKENINKIWTTFKKESLKGVRTIKQTKLGFEKTSKQVKSEIERLTPAINIINKLNKEKRLKKLDYSYLFKLAGFNNGLVPGPHDSIRWLEDIIAKCEKAIIQKGKNAIKEKEHLEKVWNTNKEILSISHPIIKSVESKLIQIEQHLQFTQKSEEERCQKIVETSHNENYILQCAERRLKKWEKADLELVENTSVCILRSANTSYTYQNNFLCFQIFNDQVLFYKSRGHKTKKFAIVGENNFTYFTAHPSRYIAPVNLKLCLKNLEIEYHKLNGTEMPIQLKSCLIEILLNQNKTSQKNLQNIRYLLMTVKSRFHCFNIGKKLGIQIKNDKNCVDYWIYKQIFQRFTQDGGVYPFLKTEDQQLETRKMLFMSYLCNLITKDSQEKDIERIKANQKYFELKVDWEKERGWKLDNNLSVEELAYGDIKGPTIYPECLNNFYEWFKLECMDYLDKFSLTKLKEPLAFDVSNSNSCMTQVKSQKFYQKASIYQNLSEFQRKKMSKIRNLPFEVDKGKTTKLQLLNSDLQKYIDFYKDNGQAWVIEELKTVEPFELCVNLPHLEGLKEMAQASMEDEDNDDLTTIIKSRIAMSEDTDSLHMCLLMKIKSLKDELRIIQKRENCYNQNRFVNKLSSRNTTAVELLNEIRKAKIKNNEIISELTCSDLLDEIPQLYFALSYKEQVGGTRELYIGDILSKISTKIVEEFAKQIKDINPTSCLYDHSSETLIRKHVRNCQNMRNTILRFTPEELMDLNEDQLSSVFVENEDFLFGSLDHSKWGPLSMPSIFADLMDIFNDVLGLVGKSENDLSLISEILWSHVTKKVEVSSEYVEYLIKKKNTELKTSINHLNNNELDNDADTYATKLLEEGKLGFQTYPYDMGQGILHGWSDIWAGKTEEYIWKIIKDHLYDYTDSYNCVTSDDQATVLIGSENNLKTIEAHYILSKCLNKKISEKSVWGTEVFEFKSVFVSNGQEIPPTIKFLVIPSFGFEVFDPLNYLNTTDTIMQEAYDNCASIDQCENLLKMTLKLLACAGFGKNFLENLSCKHFYQCNLKAIMFDNMTFTERKLHSLRENKLFSSKENQMLVAKIDKELEDWMAEPYRSIQRAKEIAKLCKDMVWDPTKYGPIRVCSGRMKSNKENNIILSLDPSRNLDDPVSSKLYNFIRKHFQSTSFSSLEQSIIESIKDSLRQMTSGESYSGLVATVRSQSFKTADAYATMLESFAKCKETLLEGYLQLKIQLIIEKFTLDEKHYYPVQPMSEKPQVNTEMRGEKINDDFLIPALASLELREPEFFKKIVEPSIPYKRMKLINSQQLIRMKLIEAADASFNMEIREPYEVFRLTSISNNSTYFQGNDGICWETTEAVGKAKTIHFLKQTEVHLILNSFINPVPLNYESILKNWQSITNLEFPANVEITGTTIQILMAHAINEKRQTQICELLKSFPQHLSEKRIYQDQYTMIVSREVLWEGQSVTLCFTRNKLDRTNFFTIYWDTVPKWPEKWASAELLEKLLESELITEWNLKGMKIKNRSKLHPNLFDKLSSPILIKEGSLGYYKFVDGIPAFQEVVTPRIESNLLIGALTKKGITSFLKEVLESYSLMGKTIFEGTVDTKPDYLTTKAGNILNLKSSVVTSIKMLSDREKFTAMKLFTECFNECIITEIDQGYILCKPGLNGWVFSTQSRFLKGTSILLDKPDDIPSVPEEDSWLD
uniref:RNA-directed RNA polymerase L n=1 Tax=Veterinary Pathology Zurich virus 1 TaxID=2447921 RepID=A0A3Q8Q312_9VIRU|nr:RNA-dependent RNA polymerase [Veterinary Pathology Zurich virus 1]